MRTACDIVSVLERGGLVSRDRKGASPGQSFSLTTVGFKYILRLGSILAGASCLARIRECLYRNLNLES
jgi:hypothetical protein